MRIADSLGAQAYFQLNFVIKESIEGSATMVPLNLSADNSSSESQSDEESYNEEEEADDSTSSEEATDDSGDSSSSSEGSTN